MTRGDRWKKFFQEKGWIDDDVIRGQDGAKLAVSVGRCDPEGRGSCTYETGIYLKDRDILCTETRSGTVFFQWDDIVQVVLEDPKQKKGWL